ncbi:hypothetical protein C8R44DRAFT_759698 [Mycena epipterygia]|nr:hypothetical protein C8R44DRAFT_759698 [Mycena epipterygia]
MDHNGAIQFHIPKADIRIQKISVDIPGTDLGTSLPGLAWLGKSEARSPSQLKPEPWLGWPGFWLQARASTSL